VRALRLKRGEDRRLRAGHLWIFSNEVNVAASPLTDFEPGEPAVVLDAAGRALGTAYVNPAPLICARLVSRKANDPLGADMLRARLARALALRGRLFDRPFYRLCHGEGDFLPGLTADRYGDILTAQFNTAGIDRLRDTLLELFHDLLRPSCLALLNDNAFRDLENLPRRTEVPVGAAPDHLELVENGIGFRAPFLAAPGANSAGMQKSGWFFDQRANRLEAARHARGARVLDAFCYAGAFGVYAATAGAGSVCFVDSSRAALEAASANLAANAPDCEGSFLPGDALGRFNKVEAPRADFSENPRRETLARRTCFVVASAAGESSSLTDESGGDKQAFQSENTPGDAAREGGGILRRLYEEGRRFDLVCLDPPAFIKRRKDAVRGAAAYRRLNALGLALLDDGGILVSSSCSHHLSAGEHARCIALAAAGRRLDAQFLYRGGQAADHPVHPAMPESAYLTCFVARVGKA
jgi:23S rRNA (cytosine1962-C5)-methyltransferase